jgi:hypothetical protein
LKTCHHVGEFGRVAFVLEGVPGFDGSARHFDGSHAGLGKEFDNHPDLFFWHDVPSFPADWMKRYLFYVFLSMRDPF